ncbi:MAG TPA: serine/threonine-protein kinase, partial [Verrucomicrobiales bacterium]|nr:serine/threonine-protein kinase [Verrucomicrobiales bacterium]
MQPWFPGLEIVELLGAGGMGAVYKARQPRLNRFVALKILTCPPEHYADFAMRFEREAQVMARLNHPHIVTIFDFGEVDRSAAGMETLFYFLMEFVDGTDLNQLIRTGELKPEEAIEFVPQICEALQFAHDEGITHRDIKPANILVDRKSHVKIADFGLAKLIQGEETLAIGLTMTGTAMGTPQYMAPEQWESPEKVDHRADIYALGVVIYELLTGERPAGVFDPPSKKCGSDKRIDTIVMRAMEKEPDRRYQQAQEINSEVTRLIASAPGLPSMRRRRQNRIGMVAGLVVAVGFGGWFLNQSEDGVADTLSTVEVPVSGKRDPMASGV